MPHTPVDIGGGVSYELYEDDGVPLGIMEDHGCRSGGRSAILFDVPENSHVPDDAKWQIESLEPLTLSPSLLCTVCGKHGYIRESKWVEC